MSFPHPPVVVCRPPYPPTANQPTVRISEQTTGYLTCPGGGIILNVASAMWGCEAAAMDKTE